MLGHGVQSLPDVQGKRTQEVRNTIEQLLRHGELGDPLPVERHLSQMLSVSRITIRRAMTSLAEGGLISREQGRGTYARLGPPVMSLGEALEVKQSFIAMLVKDESPFLRIAARPYFYRAFTAVRRLLREREVEVCLVRCGNPDSVVRQLRRRRQFFGFIAAGYEWLEGDFERACRAHVPFVVIGRQSMSAYWNVMDAGIESELWRAMEDLSPRPEDRILLTGNKNPDLWDMQATRRLIFEYLDKAGVPYDAIRFGKGGVFESHGYLSARRYIKQFGPPTIVIADGDLAAAGVYRALREAFASGDGPKIGRDVRIVGQGNFKISQLLYPPLSTFDFNMNATAETIWDMLETQRSTGRPSGPRSVAARYIRRASTGAAGAGDEGDEGTIDFQQGEPQ